MFIHSWFSTVSWYSLVDELKGIGKIDPIAEVASRNLI
jgi:hypothetical protein